MSPFGCTIHAGGYEMIVRQVYVYAFYDRASHSYAGTCSFAEKLHWIALPT